MLDLDSRRWIAYGTGVFSSTELGLWAGLWWLFTATTLLANRQAKPMISALFSGVVFVLGISIAMSPWWIRNYTITGKFVPSTLQVGASLYDGWHEGATGSSDEGMAFVEQFLKEQLAEDRELEAKGIALESTMEWRLDRRLRNAAIDWVRENPSDAISLGMVKFWKTWRPTPVAQELGSSSIRYAEGLAYVAIMALGALDYGPADVSWGHGYMLYPVFISPYYTWRLLDLSGIDNQLYSSCAFWLALV